MMDATAFTAMERLLFAGFTVAFILWATISALVVVNRALYDRRRRRLADIARALTDPAVESLPPLERSPAIRRMLDRLSRRAVYRMVASTEFPRWLTEIFAAYSLEYLGLPRMVRDASASWRGRKWRRISALFALGHMRAPGVHELVAQAVLDSDADVAAAAATILHQLGDRPAAEILVSTLHRANRFLSASRFATYLDQYPAPIDDLLLPLLHHQRASTRYWAASLLGRYPNVPGLAPRIAALTDDPDASVRKAALTTLGSVAGADAVAAARRRLADAVPYVRSTAIRLLGQHGEAEHEESRRAFASWIIPLMADTEFEVRLAAKEALARLGAVIWRQIAAQLDSSDAFVRNGAAEVLQNLGILDWGLSFLGSGVVPTAELSDVLARAFHEGGPAMIEAASARLGGAPS